jgi:hypothetical protein
MIRDKMCQFPGSHQTRYLEIHHRIPRAEGGRTLAGEPFHLHECVQALFLITLPDQDQQAA